MDRKANNLQIVMDVIRGDKHWSILKKIGINIKFDKNDFIKIKSKRISTAKPKMEDFAKGILKHWENHQELKHWAAVVLGIDAVDLEEIENHESADTILNALWDMAFGDPVNEEIFMIAEECTKKS